VFTAIIAESASKLTMPWSNLERFHLIFLDNYMPEELKFLEFLTTCGVAEFQFERVPT
jgi:hypothetical protein